MIEKQEHMLELRRIKLELRQEILEAFAHRKTTELIALTGLHQNDIGELRTDTKLNRFSVDRLLLILIALGCRPVIEVHKATATAAG